MLFAETTFFFCYRQKCPSHHNAAGCWPRLHSICPSQRLLIIPDSGSDPTFISTSAHALRDTPVVGVGEASGGQARVLPLPLFFFYTHAH